MKINKTTESKKFSVLGWFIYIISIMLGVMGFIDFSLMGFSLSYMILFLWSVHYRKSQLDKGLLMIITGAFFVIVLTTAAGLDVNEDKIFDVPEKMKLSFTALVTIAGATFFGAGGSMIANVAADHSSDSPSSSMYEKNISLRSIEGKLSNMYKLLWLVIILVITLFVFLLLLIISL